MISLGNMAKKRVTRKKTIKDRKVEDWHQIRHDKILEH